jgi:hypothetical protein
MYITKKHISRRTLLKGAGATLALPLLDAMVPAATAQAQTAAAPVPRFFGGFVCHGAAPGYWEPEAPGTLPDELPYVWSGLQQHKEQTTILTGLHATSSEPPPGETGADHWVAAAFLCAEKPKKTAGADVRAGHTIDQIIAERYGQQTLLPSIEMNVEDPGSGSSNCGEGYSCVYTNTIAWASPTTPLPMELNPQVVFERMFGNGSSPEERASRRERNRSILDSLTPKLGSLRNDFTPTDRARIDDYTDAVREIERRLEIAANASAATPENLDVPPGIPQSFDEHIKLQFDLLALAFEADITRVGTLLFARDLTGRRYPESDAPTMSFHGGSHHGEDPARINEFSKVNKYHADMVGYFADRLARTQDGDGTLLDHSLLLYGSNMGNPNQHLHYDVPHILIGGLNGKHQGNRHLAYPSKTISTGNLLVSVLEKFDIHRDSVGDSNGRLEDL